MKKKIIILSVLFTLILAGVLYGAHLQLSKVETVTAEQVYMGQYPNPMPDVILVPMTGYPLY